MADQTQTLGGLDQLGGQQLARFISGELTKGELMLGPGLIKAVAEVFPSSTEAQKFFNAIRREIESAGSERDAVMNKFTEIIKDLREKNRTQAADLLINIVKRYGKRESGLGRANQIYEVFTSSSLTKEVEEHWPKAKK